MTTPDKIGRLKAKKEEIEKRLSKLEAQEKNKTRKEETRLKILIGAAILVNIKTRPEFQSQIQKLLDRAITAKRDRDFLQERGWLPKPLDTGNREEN